MYLNSVLAFRFTTCLTNSTFFLRYLVSCACILMQKQSSEEAKHLHDKTLETYMYRHAAPSSLVDAAHTDSLLGYNAA
jgi:hypothetical protein